MSGKWDTGVAVVFEKIPIKLAHIMFFKANDSSQFIYGFGIEIQGFDDLGQKTVATDDLALYVIGNTSIHKLQPNIAVG